MADPLSYGNPDRDIEQLKEMIEKVPPEMPNNETFKDIHAQVEAFLSMDRAQVSDSYFSLPADLACGQQNQHDRTSSIDGSTNGQYHKMVVHLNAAGVSDLSQNGEDTPQDSNRSFEIREAVPLHSNESSSRSPKAPKIEGKKEVIEQFEPGVYVTLIQLQNESQEDAFGHTRSQSRNISTASIKRRFAEQQAPTELSITPRPADENNEVELESIAKAIASS